MSVHAEQRGTDRVSSCNKMQEREYFYTSPSAEPHRDPGRHSCFLLRSDELAFVTHRSRVSDSNHPPQSDAMTCMQNDWRDEHGMALDKMTSLIAAPRQCLQPFIQTTRSGFSVSMSLLSTRIHDPAKTSTCDKRTCLSEQKRYRRLVHSSGRIAAGRVEGSPARDLQTTFERRRSNLPLSRNAVFSVPRRFHVERSAVPLVVAWPNGAAAQLHDVARYLCMLLSPLQQNMAVTYKRLVEARPSHAATCKTLASHESMSGVRPQQS